MTRRPVLAEHIAQAGRKALRFLVVIATLSWLQSWLTQPLASPVAFRSLANS